MHLEADITIERPRAEVFDYLAHAEHLPEYVTDFASVRQTSDGTPRQGTEYGYEMARGKVNQVRCQASDWRTGGLLMSADLEQRIQDASRAFGKAVTRAQSEDATNQAQARSP